MYLTLDHKKHIDLVCPVYQVCYPMTCLIQTLQNSQWFDGSVTVRMLDM